MNPNAWQQDAEGLVADLTDLLRDSGRARLTILLLAAAAENSRQAAWDEIAAPVLARVSRKCPGQTRRVNALARRLRVVLFSGPAADAPARLRGLL